MHEEMPEGGQEGETGSEMDIERLKTILQESDYVHAGKWTGEAVDIEGLIDVALETLAAQEKRIAELTAAEEKRRQEVIDLTIQMRELEAERDRMREAVDKIAVIAANYATSPLKTCGDIAAIAKAALKEG